MSISLRPGKPDDADQCGMIIYDAFGAIAERHNFETDFPDIDFVTRMVSRFLDQSNVYSVVADDDGEVVGINFLHEHGLITGVGPIAVDPSAQNSGIGTVLMRDVMARAHQIRASGVRLVQDGYHHRSFALYSGLGFRSRGAMVAFKGSAIDEFMPSPAVRKATNNDIEACEQLYISIHGHDRTRELLDALDIGEPMVVERSGRIAGYTTGFTLGSHSVGETNEDLKALIGASNSDSGLEFLVPVENHDLIAWCLGHGLRIKKMMTLMTIGLYNYPQGAWMPSLLY